MTTAKPAACILLLFIFFRSASYASDERKCESHTQRDPELCSYEPSTIGYTKDSDDTGFMDFKLSVRYQLIPDWSTRGFNSLYPGLGNNSALYLAFTGRFGQYIATRDSAPVVNKRFNPKLFYRYWTDAEHQQYIDFAFLAHESNGQSIDSLAEYQAARSSSEKPEFADDQLSRGWDYLELVWKNNLDAVDKPRTLSTYVTLKYFLPRGPLQGRFEEYNEWEGNPEGKQRSHVNGVAAMIKYHAEGEWKVFKDVKAAALFETGYREIFRHNTLRIEFGTKMFQLPVTLWGQTGYGSDLAQYFRKVNSHGIELEIGSF